jgi:hypothetical protein
MRLSLFIFFITGLFAVSQGQVEIESVAKLLAKHKYKKLHRCFSKEMKANVSTSQLQEIWESIEGASGNYIDISQVEKKEHSDFIQQTGLVNFENGTYKLKLAVDREDRISGLFISQLGYQVPSYSKDLVTGKKYISFQSHSFNLSGELMLPINCNKCPLVILVHGSGALDKDETIGPNKVFYDLALGLASKGIATFRYHKRFSTYPELMEEPFDLYDETIEDAISAYHTLMSDTSLYFGNVIMLGHSLGAYAMPLIADSLRNLDGAILFSANARRLEDLIMYQMAYLTEFDGTIDDEEKELIEQNKKGFDNIKNRTYTDTTSAEELLAYWPGLFWKGIEKYNPVEQVANDSNTNYLILQGEKDYQITMVDFNLWQKGLVEHPNAELKSFENLTHLFTPTKSKKPGPSDYFMPGNVSIDVIETIANWVLRL